MLGSWVLAVLYKNNKFFLFIEKLQEPKNPHKCILVLLVRITEQNATRTRLKRVLVVADSKNPPL